jgi:hypothetical protein
MMLVVSLLLALVPLLGVAWIAMYGSVTTVDGLFMSLILLAMSGILGLNVLIGLRKRGTSTVKQSRSRAILMPSGRLMQRGKVESVQFYESSVGQPNKSIVTLSNGTTSSHMLVFDGDMRNALPVGQRVEVTFRKESGHNVLVNVDYA